MRVFMKKVESGKLEVKSGAVAEFAALLPFRGDVATQGSDREVAIVSENYCTLSALWASPPEGESSAVLPINFKAQ
jgi:hypothetical protein